MNTCPICNKHREPFLFDPIACASDEKLAFVERVCALLIESRYGLDRVYQKLTVSQHDNEFKMPATHRSPSTLGRGSPAAWCCERNLAISF